MTQDVPVRGVVLDEKNEALAGTNLWVKNTMLGVTTRTDGSFEFRLKRDRTYEVLISFIGYESQILTLEPPFRESYLIRMKRSAFIAEEVVVRGTRAGDKTPMAYENLNEEELQSSNMGQDMGYLLSLTPSVVQSSESGTGIGYTNFRIRGSDPSRINITVDGIPLNDAESQQVFWACSSA